MVPDIALLLTEISVWVVLWGRMPISLNPPGLTCCSPAAQRIVVIRHARRSRTGLPTGWRFHNNYSTLRVICLEVFRLAGPCVQTPQPPTGLFGRYVRRRRDIAILHPLDADSLNGFFRLELVQIRHEDLHTSLGRHTGISVDQLVLVMKQIEVEPRIIRNIDHDEIDVMHSEPPEVEGAATEPQKIPPLLYMDHSLSISVDFFEIRIDDADAGELTTNMGRR